MPDQFGWDNNFGNSRPQRIGRWGSVGEWLAHKPNYVKCGNCKATGVKHVWNKTGDLVPTDPPLVCAGCNGTGMALAQDMDG